MRQRDVFSDQASIASWALFTLHRKKLYEYRNANGVKISVKMRSPEHYLLPAMQCYIQHPALHSECSSL
ncbi:hypothetical protein GFB31_23050 [Escherichia coli]|nr:hypothetical protein [Escherichia coli]EFH9021708.1 hypothetical protein [Escherichia coli]